MTQNLRLEWRTAEELADNPANWRTHPEAQKEALEAVLSDVGWAGALLYNERTGRLIDGHLRKQLAKGPMPVLIGSWTPEQEFKILVTLDPIAAMATIDDPLLATLMEGVSFESDAVNQMLSALLPAAPSAPKEDPGAQIDRAEELRVKWSTERGQVWEIGRHRLMCGDATRIEDVQSLMNGVRVGSVITDPPYGIERQGITNDAPEGLSQLYLEVLSILPCEDAVVIAFQSPRLFPVWLGSVVAAGHKFERSLWSYKPNGIRFPWRGWILKSDIILVSTLGTPSWPDNPPNCHDTYTYTHQFEIEHTGSWHGSVKPLEEVCNLIGHTVGDVYDPFLGSGTTMVAAEQLGRICYGMEIEPKYVAVALERMAGMGLEPKLVKK